MVYAIIFMSWATLCVKYTVESVGLVGVQDANRLYLDACTAAIR